MHAIKQQSQSCSSHDRTQLLHCRDAWQIQGLHARARPVAFILHPPGVTRMLPGWQSACSAKRETWKQGTCPAQQEILLARHHEQHKNWSVASRMAISGCSCRRRSFNPLRSCHCVMPHQRPTWNSPSRRSIRPYASQMRASTRAAPFLRCRGVMSFMWSCRQPVHVSVLCGQKWAELPLCLCRPVTHWALGELEMGECCAKQLLRTTAVCCE